MEPNATLSPSNSEPNSLNYIDPDNDQNSINNTTNYLLEIIKRYFFGLIGAMLFSVVFFSIPLLATFTLLSGISSPLAVSSSGLSSGIVSGIVGGIVLFVLTAIVTVVVYRVTKQLFVFWCFAYGFFIFPQLSFPATYFIGNGQELVSGTSTDTVTKLGFTLTIFLLPFAAERLFFAFNKYKSRSLNGATYLLVHGIAFVVISSLFLLSGVTAINQQQNSLKENKIYIPADSVINAVIIPIRSSRESSYVFNVKYPRSLEKDIYGSSQNDELVITPIKNKDTTLDVLCGTASDYLRNKPDENFVQSINFEQFKTPGGVEYWLGMVTATYKSKTISNSDKTLNYRVIVACFELNTFQYEIVRKVSHNSTFNSDYPIDLTIDKTIKGKSLLFGCAREEADSPGYSEVYCTGKDASDFGAKLNKSNTLNIGI